MRVRMRVEGDLNNVLTQALERGAAAVTRAVGDAGEELKREWSRQVRSAGLGNRLANSVRGRRFPRAGTSLGAASTVWTKAPKILRAFEDGATIRSRDGFWLAIPTPAAPRRGVGGKRITPSNFPEHRYGPLRFVYRPGKPGLLVVDGVGIGRSGRVGRQRRRTKSGGLRSGSASVVMFILVPQVRLRKRLDLEAAGERAIARLPGRIAAEWRLEDR